MDRHLQGEPSYLAYDDDLFSEASFGHVVCEGHIRLLCLAVYGGEVFLADAYTHLLVFQK